MHRTPRGKHHKNPHGCQNRDLRQAHAKFCELCFMAPRPEDADQWYEQKNAEIKRRREQVARKCSCVDPLKRFQLISVAEV
jgi:hypothetical protein